MLADGQIHTLTDWQTQTDFIICPMIYAMAVGQIIILYWLQAINKFCKLKT